MTEIERINQVVDAFACAIKERMTKKYEEGYVGWDGEYPESALIEELVSDAEDINRNLPLDKFKTTCTNVLLKRTIDVGARSMMLWYRHNHSLHRTSR